MNYLMVRLLGVLVSLSFFYSPTTHAYDKDTHFYMTYVMARYAGLKHEVAARIALGGEWGDEHWVSSPMLLTKMRKIHFPGYVKASKMAAYDLVDLGIGITKTEAQHDFATEMFTEGLKEGSFFKAVQSFHTMQDSFSHHGTPEILGHSMGGHWPDRPFWREYFWYSDMVKANFEMIWALRELMDVSAMDTDLRPFPGAPYRNYQMTSDELTGVFLSLPQVKHVATHDILTDPEYVEFAVRNQIELAVKAGFIKNQNVVWQALNTEDYSRGEYPQVVLERTLTRLVMWEAQVNKDRPGETHCGFGVRILDRDAVSKDLGVYLCDPVWLEETEKKGGTTKGAVAMLVKALTQGHIPLLPSKYESLLEVELEGPIRVKEMEIRERQIKSLIRDLYGINVHFVPNEDVKKQVMDILHTQVFPPKESFGVTRYNRATKTHEITISDEDQDRYAQMIKMYLFPRTFAPRTWGQAGKETLYTLFGGAVGGYMGAAGGAGSGTILGPKGAAIGAFIGGLGGVTTGASAGYLAAKWDDIRADVLENRIVAGPHNLYYRNERTFPQRKGSMFKYLLSARTVQEWEATGGGRIREGGALYSDVFMPIKTEPESKIQIPLQ